MMMMLFQGPYFKQQDFIVEELHKGYLKELEEFDYVIAIGNLRERKDEQEKSPEKIEKRQ